jgi:hypothetical protein
MFIYVPNIKRFVAAAGMQSYGGEGPRHYDTEEFDLAALKWVNAYPAGVAGTRPESGPVGTAYSKERAMAGHNGGGLFYKDGEFLRVGAGGQWLVTRVNYECCYVPDNGKAYLYVYDRMLCYDPAKRTWEDTNAKPRTSCKIWGSMAYDPVNKEIFHAGGDGGSAEVGTWVYSIEKNEWRKLEFGSDKVKALSDDAKKLCWRAKALLGAVTNRFAISETKAEAKADLKAKAAELSAALEKLSAAVNSAGLTGVEKAGGDVAIQRLDATRAGLTAVADKLAGPIAAEAIGEVRAVRAKLEQVIDALAVEPPGRARSQVAYDPVRKKMVLFGGDQLDRVLSDTWLYDCATRTWEQRFPKECPLPRAGHIFAWLPKAKKIVLAGGYSRDWLAQQIWTYDVEANEWKMLLHIPLAPEDYGRQQFSQNCPRVDARGPQTGAVNDDDVLLCINGLNVWACKIEPGKPTSAPDGQTGASGDYKFNRIDPALWEKVAGPDAAATRKFYTDLPVNQWTALKFARYAPGARNRWGTTAYDIDRHQLLFWGGGHSTSQENDVAHFSVLGNCWTVGYHPDDPIEIIYASVPTPVSFHDRAHVPMHAYKAYCYDQTAGKMLYLDRAYDPAVREWEPKPYPGLQHVGTLSTFVQPTPIGAVTYSAKGLFRFDAKAGQWVKMPWEGPNPNGLYADGHALRHDSKRNCLWLTNEKDIYKYDLASGKAEKIAVTKPKALGQFLFWSEEVYLPDADLILLMNLFTRPDGKPGNVAWDPNDSKFYWVDLKFVEADKPVEFTGSPFSWSDALAYDPELKLVLLNNSSAGKVWAMKFDRKSAKMEPME